MSEMLSGRELVSTVAGPREWGDDRRRQIARAARRGNVTYRMARAIYYGEVKDREHKAWRRLEAAALARKRTAAADLRARLVQAADRQRNSSDPDFFVFDLAALDDAISALGRMAGTEE